ncbi:MAG: serine/threonine-protein kinase [Gemmataceae bacterium]|nr:serine/threonine-protein kinase [Gemmataceae bacterium]
MSVYEHVSELLLHWEDLHEQGRSASALDLAERCSPEERTELRRRIEALRSMMGLMEGRAGGEDGNGKATRLPSIPGYEIVAELGNGGMGVVYLAWHLGLKRQVALKMLHGRGGASPERLARFRQEAESIARLQHPNIVHIYDVGDHDSLPYYAMECVAGGSLATKLAGAPQPPREAATVVHVLARAVAAAHDQGVIHRDLKPANVLLQISECRWQIAGSPDAQSAICDLQSAIPKIADFGLAKRLDADIGQTHTGEILGTPSYMAPEQASGVVDAIGPATDVYALGAILYEMLAGRPPFRGASPLDTLEQVRRQDPVPPSRLVGKVPRDLETICLKCLQKEPEARYAGALALADDLGRFLRDEPIQARRVSRFERAWRWCRRNPRVLLLAAALVVAVGAVAAALAVQQRARWRLNEAKSHVRQQVSTAWGEGREAAAGQLIDEFMIMLAADGPAQAPLKPRTRQALLERALRHYREQAEETRGQPARRADYAHACHRLGELHRCFGQRGHAEQSLREALTTYQTLLNDAPGSVKHRFNLAWCRGQLGETIAADRPDEAVRAYREALTLLQQLPAEVGDPDAPGRERARLLTNLGKALRALGRHDDAAPCFDQAAKVWSELAGEASHDPQPRLESARCHDQRAAALEASGQAAAAEAAYREARTVAKRLADDFPTSPWCQRELANALYNLARLAVAGRRSAEARALVEDAVRHQQAAMALHPNDPELRASLDRHQALASQLAGNRGKGQ